MNLLHGIPLSIWYDWKNDGTDSAEREHNFGTVDHDLIPKPAYSAIRTLTRELSGCRLVRRLKLPRDDDFLLLFVNSAKQRTLAAWTLAEPHRIETELPIRSPGRISGVNSQGEDYLPRIERGRLQLDLDASPQYLRLGRVLRSDKSPSFKRFGKVLCTLASLSLAVYTGCLDTCEQTEL